MSDILLNRTALEYVQTIRTAVNQRVSPEGIAIIGMSLLESLLDDQNLMQEFPQFEGVYVETRRPCFFTYLPQEYFEDKRVLQGLPLDRLGRYLNYLDGLRGGDANLSLEQFSIRGVQIVSSQHVNN